MKELMFEIKLVAFAWVAVEIEVRLPWLGNFINA